MKKIVLFVWWLFSVAIVLAQSGFEVKGVVVDSLSGEKLPYVRVGLVTGDSLQRVVAVEFTGEDGVFSIKGISKGNYVLKLFLMGYDMQSVPVDVQGDKLLNLGTLALKKQSQSLEEVTVAAQKPVYMFDGEKTLYNVSEDPMVQSGTASDALQNAPGVEVDVEGNVTLRGVSSVEIWINNKPSNMNEAALKNFIKELPAGSIEKIEVITNPSARYSAKGKGGVINIVTNTKIKKNNFFSFGMNATTMPNLSPWLSYVWANEKWSISVYAQYSYNQNRYFLEAADTKFAENNDTASVTKQKTIFSSPFHSGGVFFNSSCQIDSANAIYMWAGGYPTWHKSSCSRFDSRQEYRDMVGQYDYLTYNQYDALRGGGYAGLWYTHQFNDQGHEISANLSGNAYGSTERGEQIRACPLHEDLDYTRQIRSHDLSYTLDAGVDYTIPYHPDGEISIGTEAMYSSTDEMFRHDTLVRFSDCVYNLDSMRFKDSHIDGIGWDTYITLQHRFGRFTMKAGLRSEYVFYDHRYANSPKDNGRKHYWGLYPSLHLTYTTESMDNFKLSYTRRVSNPDAVELTTFIEYDDDSYSIGNPALRPAYTNAVEAGWTRFIPKFGNIGITAYFNNTKDEYNSLMDVAYNPYYGRIVSYSMPINAGKSLNTGAELNVTYQLKAFMSIRFYATLQYMQSQFEFRDELYKVQNLGYQFRLNFWAKVWKVLEINLSANYRSKSKTLFTTERPFYTINGGLRVELWKRLLALHVNVNNIFNWNKNGQTSENPYFTGFSTYMSSWSGRHIAVGITFRFGKMELESQAAHGNMPTGTGMSMP
ncbi:MAG: outer membrane beta-barrel protein [Bacteroidales bacterium]|nr:outer membrane beta-barrel protein [Bacteroidales bacterium]